MKFSSALIAVKDMEASKHFYTQLLGQEIMADFGANVVVGGVALQTLDSWTDFIDRDAGDICFGGNAGELYFEEEDLDAFLEKLDNWPGIERVHGLKEFPWGQRVIRFYDPDRHIVEVGETMENVVKRLLLEGMSIEDASQKSMFPPPFVEAMKAELVREGKLT